MVSIISCRRPSTPENSTGSDYSPTVSPTTGSPKKHIIRITAEQMRWYRAQKIASLRRQEATVTVAGAETATITVAGAETEKQTTAAAKQTAKQTAVAKQASRAKKAAEARRKVLAVKARAQAQAAAAKQQAPAAAAAAAATVPAPARRVRIVSTKRRGSS
ncbi:hypothetical protein VPNG_09270 [Cytospora leucostoma]|uniref:Uncharacterized protein n=1 Tax=Cytospora leucostoma TaxID=1230097 RepID=A0A423W0T1_9PEZI|nr:hypothetical protein VPNG_09270 [Cytospora leucostoma]